MNTSASNEAIKVLLVEDSPGDARLIREMLKDASPDKFDLTWVERFADAVTQLAGDSVDVILLDLSLPDVSGLETLIQMHTAALFVPIVVLTGRNDESLGVQAMGEGAQDYLLKHNLDSPLLKRVLRYAIERKRVDQTQHQSEERLSALVQNATDIITILAADMTVLYESPSLEKVTGYKPEDVQGLSITDIIHPDDLPAVIENMTNMFAQPGATFSVEVRLRHADGSWRAQEAIVTNLLDHPAIHGIVVNSRDVTERKRAEQALRQYNQRLGILHSIDRGILTAEPPQRIAQMVAQSLTDLIHCDAVRIIPIDTDDYTSPYLADYPPANQASQDLLRQTIEKYGLPESFHRGEPLLVDDTRIRDSLWGGFEEVLTAKGARSWIIVPLIAGEQLVGILAVGSVQPFAFTPEHTEITREVADQLAIALHKNHLDEQIQEHAHRLEARVTERTEQLLSAKERSETILMSASDAMIVADLDGNIKQVNTAFTVLFDYTFEQGRTVSLYSLLDSASAATVRRIGAELAQGGQTQHVELVGVRHNGTLFDADAAFAPVVDGLPTILICSIRDITERKRAEEGLRQALAKEKELSEIKTRFVSMVSHDFRTPLASIQSSSDLLRNYSERMTDVKKQQHFTTINGQIKHLTGLLEDMLTITKAESVGLPFHPTLTDLGVFCQTIANEMQQLDGTRQINFTINRPGELVKIDPDLLRRALVNLLSNAVKYSPAGGVAEFDVLSGNKDIEFRIKDHGIGIPEVDQDHLFEVFHRAHNVGQISGTGLGLAIVKRVVDAHGGTVTVHSEVDVGSTFTISIPKLRAEQETL